MTSRSSGIPVPVAPPPQPRVVPRCDHPGCTAAGSFAEPVSGGLRHLCFAHLPAETRALWQAHAGERRGVAA